MSTLKWVRHPRPNPVRKIVSSTNKKVFDVRRDGTKPIIKFFVVGGSRGQKFNHGSQRPLRSQNGPETDDCFPEDFKPSAVGPVNEGESTTSMSFWKSATNTGPCTMASSMDFEISDFPPPLTVLGL
jgi:hypothetical protein